MRATQHMPVTQDYLANAKAGRIRTLFVSLAFAALDATIPQLHTEVAGASWLQLAADSRQYLPTRPSSTQGNNLAAAQVPSDQKRGEGTKEPKQTAC